MRRYDKPFIGAAICLAGLAGFIDALGFLSLGGFFVSFMSGNTTRLGVGITAQAWPEAIRAGTLILLFVLGAMAGTLVAHAARRWRKPAVLGSVTVLLLAAATAHALGWDGLAGLLLAMAMGAENGTFQRDGEVSIGLTYMTGTLVRFAQRAALALVGGERWSWVPHLLLWLGFVSGVLSGTRAYLEIGLDGLWIAVTAAAMLTGFTAVLTRLR